MEEMGAGQMLASKWDIVPSLLGGFLRVLLGNILPGWAKAIILGIIGSVALWTAITWFRRRSTRAT
ncbi:hypothetical protein ACFXB3_30535 [Streptomyces sp. NPDC059447]|uniref:hypothetical protein n=1 Tax=Streptomyces sp. NPDC059447 TaxID=3346834 RepID=UPI0036BC0D47